MQTKQSRKAGNITPEGDNIDGWIYGGSNTRVIKFGRSTGGSQGITSAGAVISWQNGSKTIELLIAQPQGELELFCNTATAYHGDSGALLFTETNPYKGHYEAVGLLHGN